MNDLENLFFLSSKSKDDNNDGKTLKFEDLFSNNFQKIILTKENDNNNDLKLNDYNLGSFNEKILNKNKDNLLYYSLSSSELKKIHLNNLDNFLYNYFFSYTTEKSMRIQKFLNTSIKNNNINYRNENYSLLNILNLLTYKKKIENKESNIINIIMKFLYILSKPENDNNNINLILEKLYNLKECFKFEYNKNIFNNLQLDYYKAIENFILILNLNLYNKYKNNKDQLLKIFKKTIKIIKYFKSQKVLFNFLYFIKEDGNLYKNLIIKNKLFNKKNVFNFDFFYKLKDYKNVNIFNFINLYYKIFNKNELKINGYISYIKKDNIYLFLILNYHNEFDIIYLVISIEQNKIINLKHLFKSKEKIENFNVIKKYNFIFICYSSNKNFYYRIYSENLMFLKENKIDFNNEIILKIFYTMNFVYIIKIQNKITLIDLNYEINKFDSFLFNEKKNSIELSNLIDLKISKFKNILYLYDQESKNIYLSEFSKNKDKIILKLFKTHHIFLKDIFFSVQKNKLLTYKLDDFNFNYYFINNSDPNFYSNVKYLPFNYYNNDYNSIKINNSYSYILIQYINYINNFGNFNLKTNFLNDPNLLNSPQFFCLNSNIVIDNEILSKFQNKKEDLIINIKILCQYLIVLYNSNNKIDENIISFFKEIIFNYENIKNENKIFILYEFLELNKIKKIKFIKDSKSFIFQINNNDKLNIIEKLIFMVLFYDKEYFLDFIKLLSEYEYKYFQSEEYLNNFMIIQKISKYFFNNNFINYIYKDNSNIFLQIKDNLINILKSIKKDKKKFIFETNIFFNLFTMKLFFYLLQILYINEDFEILNNIEAKKKLLLIFILLDDIFNDVKKEKLDMNNLIEIDTEHPINNYINNNYLIKYDDNQNLLIDRFDYIYENYYEIFNKENKINFDFNTHLNINELKIHLKYQMYNENKNYGQKLFLIPINKSIEIKFNENIKFLNLIIFSLLNYILFNIKESTFKYDKNFNKKNEKFIEKIFKSKVFNKIKIENNYKSQENLYNLNDLDNKEKINLVSANFNMNEKKIINTLNNSIDFNNDNIKKCIKILNNEIKKKQLNLSILGGEKYLNLVYKTFKIVIKYFNLFDVFLKFSNDLLNNNDYSKVENYNLFYLIFYDCSKIRTLLIKQKNLIEEPDFELKHNNLLNKFKEKISFIYDIIISTQDEKYNSKFTENLLEIIFDDYFDINHLKNYNKIKNESCLIKINFLSLINAILYYSKNEIYINFALDKLQNFINIKKDKNKLFSFFNDSNGTDFIYILRLRNNFEYFLKNIYNKITNKNNNFFYFTKINLYKNLIFKYKINDFYIIEKYLNVFDLLLNFNKKLNNENEFGLIKFNENSFYQTIINLFNIILLQLFNKISKNFDVINKKVYINIINYFINFFTTINLKNSLFEEIFLTFYKSLINKTNLIKIIIEQNIKIFDLFINILNEKSLKIQTKFICSKILFQFFEIYFNNNFPNLNIKEIFTKIYKIYSEEKTDLIKEENSKILILFFNKNISFDINKNFYDLFPILEIKYNDIKIGNYYKISDDDDEINYKTNNIFYNIENNENIKKGILLDFDEDYKNEMKFKIKDKIYFNLINENNNSNFNYYNLDSIQIKNNIFDNYNLNKIIIDENSNLINENTKIFIKKNYKIIIEKIIEILNNENYKFNFIILKLLKKIIDLNLDEENDFSLKNKIINVLLNKYLNYNEKINNLFNSYEFLIKDYQTNFIDNYLFINKYYEKNDSYKNSNENLLNLFSFNVAKNGLNILYEKKKITIFGTFINDSKVNFSFKKNYDLMIFPQNNYEKYKQNENIIILMESLNENNIKILKKNNINFKCLICQFSEIERIEINFPILIISKDDFNLLFNFFVNKKVSNSNLFYNFFDEDCFDEIDNNNNENKNEDDIFGSLFNENKSEKKLNFNKLIKSKNNYYQLLNKKISERIFFKLITNKNIIKNVKNFDLIIKIYFSLLISFYFNLKYKNFSKFEIKNIIFNFLNNIKENSNLFDYLIDELLSKKIQFDLEFDHFLKQTKVYLNKEFYYFNFIYENILYFFQTNLISFLNKEKIFLILENIFNLFNELKQEHLKNNFISEFILKIFSQIYLILSQQNEKNSKLKEIYLQFFTKNSEKINSLINKLINFIDFKNYLTQHYKKTYKINLCEAIFKYFDIIFMLMLRYNYKNLIMNWLISNKDIFIFYKNYTILSINMKYDNYDDIKEKICEIAYFTRIINNFFDIKNDENNNSKCIKILNDNLSEFQLNKSKINLIKINKTKNSLKDFKLCLFSKDFDDSYNLIDIINIKNSNNLEESYYLNFYDEKIYFANLKYIKTKLYAFGFNFSNSLGINGLIGKSYSNPTLCEGISNYIWDFSHGENFTIALDEKEKKVFSCGINSGGGLKSISKETFTANNKINNNLLKEKIIEIKTNSCNSSLILTKENNVYGIGNNKNNILGKEIKENSKIPIKLNLTFKEKVKSLNIGFNNSFIITESGNGFALGDNSKKQISKKNSFYEEWEKISLPNSGKYFNKVSIGKNYFLFIITHKNNKNFLYAKGDNSHCQCGMGKENETIEDLTLIKNVEDIEFKNIYASTNSSAALTLNGELYIFGENKNFNLGSNEEIIEFPILIKNDKKIIFDDLALCDTHMLLIGREFYVKNEKEFFKKKVFSCGNNEFLCLGRKNNNNNFYEKNLKEINFDFNHEIPIKIGIANNKSFVLTVNKNEILNNLKNKIDVLNKENEIEISIYNTIKIEDFILNFYKNYNDNFIRIIKSISNNLLQNFIDIQEEIMNEKESEINYENLVEFLKKNKIYRDLHNLIIKDENNETNEKDSNIIISYIKFKLNLINTEIIKYIDTNETSESKNFLQKCIGDNISFLSPKIRLKKFLENLKSLNRYRSKHYTIKIDRFKANNFYEKNIKDNQYNTTIFGQVYQNVFNKLQNSDYFIEKNGRIFTVALQGEHATDQGGPFHEVITDLCKELQSNYLDLFIKTPNNFNDVGENRDKFIFNPEVKLNIHKNLFNFIGKLMASAISTGEVLDLNLHPIVFKVLLGNEIKFYDLQTLDEQFFKLIEDLEIYLQCNNNDNNNKNKINSEEFKQKFNLTFTISNSNNKIIELIPNGKNVEVSLENLKDFIDLAKNYRINEYNFQIKYLLEGFYSIIKKDIIQVLTWIQLEELICGKVKLDIEMLKKHTKYEGFNEKSPTILLFWKWLEKADDNIKNKYLKFVWGRTRLPKENIIDFQHKISKANQGNNFFPRASTCFFQLHLPEYSNIEILTEKMNYSVLNCYEIDGDH